MNEETDIEFVKMKICNKCKKEFTADFFYGRNKVCKRCYNSNKEKKRLEKNPPKKWRCKFCGTADLNLKYGKYRICFNCIKNYVPKKYSSYYCLDCGDKDIANRSAISMYCKKCESKRVLERRRKRLSGCV